MKKIICALIIISFIFPTVCAFAEAPTENDTARILIEAETGTILLAENETARLPIASITKVMLLLLAAEDIAAGALSFEETALCSANASSMDGSVIWLEPNEQMSVGELIKTIIIASANDSAVCLAEHIEGSEAAFVERMNLRARELGMTETHFDNCVGYDGDKHYSSARDCAIMTAELMKHDCFSEFYQIRLDYARKGTDREAMLLNTNKLIGKYEGLEGGKTGTTDNAGYCFTASAKRGEMRLISVILGAESDDERFSMTSEMLDFGFDSFELFTPEFPPELLKEIVVKEGVRRKIMPEYAESKKIVLKKGSSADILYSAELSEELSAPVVKGDVVGGAFASLGETKISETDIISSESVGKLTFLKSFELLLAAFFGKFFV